MIHNDIQNQLALLVKTSAPPLIEVADSPLEAPQWVPGQRLPAHVIASLPNGRFQVQVESQVLDMNLPRNSQPGEKLELTFLAASPRMTFALTQELQSSLPTPANSGVTLSDTARFLGALLQKGNTASASGTLVENRTATAELARTAVVVPGAPPATREFAQALHTAVSQSGLFYESHQAQWVTGERTLASLLQEPQAHLPVLTTQPQPANTSAAMPPGGAAGTHIPGAAADAAPAGSPALSQAPEAATPGNSGVVRDLSLRPHQASDSQSVVVRDPVHALAQPIVQQQLDTLETRQIVWQGQVWPGQQMDWEIDEDASRGAEDEQEAPRWRTRLHLEMPGLGGVTAKLMLDGNGVRVEFVADGDKTAALLQSDIASLAQSMEAQGIRVAGLMVNQDGAV